VDSLFTNRGVIGYVFLSFLLEGPILYSRRGSGRGSAVRLLIEPLQKRDPLMRAAMMRGPHLSSPSRPYYRLAGKGTGRLFTSLSLLEERKGRRSPVQRGGRLFLPTDRSLLPFPSQKKEEEP